LQNRYRIAQNGLSKLNRNLQSNQVIIARYTAEVSTIPRQVQELEAQLNSIQSSTGSAGQTVNDDQIPNPNKPPPLQAGPTGRVITPPATTTPTNATQPDVGVASTGVDQPTKTFDTTQATYDGVSGQTMSVPSVNFNSNSTVDISADPNTNIGNESIIPFLCQALEEESNLDVQFCIMDAMIAINRSTPQSVMSETSQSNKYNIVQPQNVQIIEQGDGIIHNYATPQNLAEAAQEIQQLISQLTQTYPTNTEIEKQTFVAQVDAEIKKNSRLRSILITGGIELIKILCPPLGIPIEMGKKWLETANLSE
jgi:hypothetical protein